jgi:DHA2 family multidrug resistance protein
LRGLVERFDVNPRAGTLLLGLKPAGSSPFPNNGSIPVDVVEYGRRRTLIVVGIMMAALLQTLDATIVNVALPTIEGNIGASIDDGTWIITGYIISNVIAIPLAPFLLQRLGRRQYYAICIAGFMLASFACGTATTLGALVFFRIVQGAFGGGLIATSQIILRDTFPPDKLGTSSAFFAIALTVGPALGPTLGGFLTDNLSWPWVFDINIVPGAIALTIVLTLLRNPVPPRRIAFDGVGVGLLAVGLGAFQYVLDEGERNDWFDDARIVFFAAMAVAGIAAFIVWELRGARNPIVDLRIFRYVNVRVGSICAVLLGMVIFGPTVMLPQYVQNVLGFTATLSGLLILTRALPVLLLTPFVARFASRFDVRLFLAIGFLLSALSFAVIASHMTPQSDFGTFAGALIVSGIGQSMLLVPLLMSILGTIAPADSPKASSFISLSVQLGGSIASTILVTIFDRRTYFHSDMYRSAATLANPALQRIFHNDADPARIARAIAAQATNAGFADAIYVLVPLAVAAAVFVVLLRPRKHAVSPAAVAAE